MQEGLYRTIMTSVDFTRRDGLAFFQAQLAHGVGGND